MEKYVKVTWPESQDWMAEEYEGEVIQASDEHTIYTFVPEELYNRVNGASDGVWDAIHMIQRATRKDDVTNLDRQVLESLLLDVYAKLLGVVL